jgi:uncharacterized protein
MKKTLFAALALSLPLFATAGSYDDMLNAVKLGDVKDVSALIQRGMDVNTTDQSGNALLAIAAREGHPDIVKLLINERAKLNARNANGETALSLAAFQGHLEIVRQLVEAGASPDTTGWPPLVYAAFNGYEDIVVYLLGQGADVNITAVNGMTPLMAAARGGFMPITRKLLAAHADVNRLTGQNLSAYDWAQRTHNTDVGAVIAAAGGKRGSELTPAQP